MIKKIRGRGAVKGIAEGEAIVCPESIQGWAGIDDITGIIIEKGHTAQGECIDGKIVVIPSLKGSNCWSGHFNSAMINGKKPAGVKPPLQYCWKAKPPCGEDDYQCMGLNPFFYLSLPCLIISTISFNGCLQMF